jgi:hypothetical protein
VWYELFDFEVGSIDCVPRPEVVELRRQMRLEMVDASSVYLAWTWGPAGDDYHVAYAGQSFCGDDLPEQVREVSQWPLWAPLIGRPIELIYHGDMKQVLEIRAGTAAVYCCSFGQGAWVMDVLRVGADIPQ